MKNLDIALKEKWSVIMTSQAPQQTVDDHRANYARFSIYTGIGVLAAGGLLLVAFILTGAGNHFS